MLNTELWAEVQIVTTTGGGMKVATSQYTAEFGSDGGLRSLRVAELEFLKSPEWHDGAGMFAVDYVPPGNIGIVSERMQVADTSKLEVRDNAITVSGDRITLEYRFRETGFDVLGQSKIDRDYLLLFPSTNVRRSLDSLTDRPILMAGGKVVGMQQEGMRWPTRQGPMLRFDEREDGYASFYWWSDKYGGTKRAVSAQIRSRKRPLFSVEALPEPLLPEAIQFSITAENADFLLPGDKPVSFKIQAENLTPDGLEASVDFEVRDFLSQKPVAQSRHQITLRAGEQKTFQTAAKLSRPGPYRGALVLRNGERILRELKWVFTYDFANYQPEATRPEDFQAFWKKTLTELGRVPLKPEMKLSEKWSTDTIEVFEVRLMSLDNKHFWGWYSRPKKEGRFPGHFICPPTGLFQPGGPSRSAHACTFSIAIHGFDLHLSDVPDGPHPWKGYRTLGIESRETASWRWIYASLVRGMDFLSQQPEVNEDRIAVSGSSQGGGLALVLAGLDHRMHAVFPQYPRLPRLDWTVKHNTGYWPFKMSSKPAGQTEQQFLHTLSYFDAANFTQDIQCPTVILVGLLDWVTASGNLINAAAHLKPGQVQLICDPWGGHGSASMTYRNRFQDSLNNFLRKNAPPVVKPSK
ncbi:MAG: acetylxylan esterase [Limisphaerales bacterium]